MGSVIAKRGHPHLHKQGIGLAKCLKAQAHLVKQGRRA